MKPNYSYNNSDEIMSLVDNLFMESSINVKMISVDGVGMYVLEAFNKEIMPGIIISDEIPPVLKNHNELDDYSTDRLMGIYSHQTRAITIYPQGIEKVKQKLIELHPEYAQNKKTNLYANLIKIVILHELGHYFFHNMDFKRVIWNSEDPKPFAPIFINDMIDEWVAQSFAYNCVKDSTDLAKTFLQLTKIQSIPYQSFIQENLKSYLSRKEDWSRLISYFQYFNVKVQPWLDKEVKSQIGNLEITLNNTKRCIDMDKYNC